MCTEDVLDGCKTVYRITTPEARANIKHIPNQIPKLRSLTTYKKVASFRPKLKRCEFFPHSRSLSSKCLLNECTSTHPSNRLEMLLRRLFMHGRTTYVRYTREHSKP